MAQFPGVIGCIDGTIKTPRHNIRSTYTNRHGGTSMTLQAICDANKKFIDVCTGTPSRMHDARVYTQSEISKNLQQICEGKYHILGDGAYEIREWFLTPYRNYENLSDQKKKYNDKFCTTRVFIENAFGILKKRFLQLLRVELADVDRKTKFIISCCVLHNICLDGHDDVPELADENIEGEIIGGVEERDYSERSTHLRRLGEIKRTTITEGL